MPDHPFGDGQERHFGSLLAAFGIFVAGAGFSVFEGLPAFTRRHNERPLTAYVTLGLALVAEGTSFARAFWRVREAGARRKEILDHVESSPDITVSCCRPYGHSRQGGELKHSSLGLSAVREFRQDGRITVR
jgi:divalent metal cation (Fe/Co/Zn/Cd) transporter